MKIELQVADHQRRVEVPEAWLCFLEERGALALERIARDHLEGGRPALAGLECVEVALVDDETSDRVHRDFMGIEGATDVITFDHGEIVIGAEVAVRQAAEYGEPVLRELLRYLIHGLLHLAGHDDATEAEREAMERRQEALVEEFGDAG